MPEPATRLRSTGPAPVASVSGSAMRLVNRSDAEAVYLEIGSRHPDDLTVCSDIDMKSANSDGPFRRKARRPTPQTRRTPGDDALVATSRGARRRIAAHRRSTS